MLQITNQPNLRALATPRALGPLPSRKRRALALAEDDNL
jgi:hypothetical protein